MATTQQRRGSDNAIAVTAQRLPRPAIAGGAAAADVNLLREQAQQARRQSPIEVLLSGLTSRTLPRGR
jgi:hypothetical protein